MLYMTTNTSLVIRPSDIRTLIYLSSQKLVITLCTYAQQGYAFGHVGLCMHVCIYIYIYICGQKIDLFIVCSC